MNIDDGDLLSSESVSEIPHHGNLEAFVAHSKLANIMGRRRISYLEVITHASSSIEELENWKNSLLDFLEPRQNTFAGQRTYERQNTFLKLAYAHIQILTTRRCLTDLNRTSLTDGSPTDVHRFINTCVEGIRTIVDASYELMNRGTLFQEFWFTQYISLVAISALYVIRIQRRNRHALLYSGSRLLNDVFPDVDEYFEKAKECQRYLGEIVPTDSQSR